jgi:hypothetical protein
MSLISMDFSGKNFAEFQSGAVARQPCQLRRLDV